MSEDRRRRDRDRERAWKLDALRAQEGQRRVDLLFLNKMLGSMTEHHDPGDEDVCR